MNSQSNRSNLRWLVCGLLFLATTINYMDRSALSLVEPILKHILGGDRDIEVYNRSYSNIVNCFILAYGLGFLVAESDCGLVSGGRARTGHWDFQFRDQRGRGDCAAAYSLGGDTLRLAGGVLYHQQPGAAVADWMAVASL